MSITHVINWVPENAGKQGNFPNKKNVYIELLYTVKFEIYKYIKMCVYIYIYEHTYVHVCNLYEFSVTTTKNHYKAVGY